MASPAKNMSMEAEEEPPHGDESLTEDRVQQILSVEDKSEHNNEDDKGGEPEEPDENEDNKGGEPEPEEQIKRGPLYRCLVNCHCACFARFIDHWPRVASFFLGVLIPLWALIAISFIFGTWLATVESPQELEDNDAIMAHTAKLNLMASLFADISSLAMVFCLWRGDQDAKLVEFNDFLQLFNNTLNETDLEEILAQAKDINFITTNFTNFTRGENFTTGSGDKDMSINVTVERMIECNEIVQNLTSAMFASLARYAMSLDDPTFNWNRCSDEVNETKRVPFPSLGNAEVDSFKPEAQLLHYAEAWIDDRDRILNELRQQNPNSNVQSDLSMFITACDQATGSQSCHPNSFASTWFWFTIMTTMGYGNQSPGTSAGRTMVYTLGFMSLLCFGAVLAYAGFVISSIVDDAFHKTNLDFLLNSWVSSLMWGCFAYSWMLVIAKVYVSWRQDKLDDHISLADGYWYAYISTTTIGLGDFYLEPEVITGRDLLSFPFVILIGFVFFSAFLGKLGELFAREDKIIGQTLQDRLAATRLFRCCRRRSPPN